jgi:hypothetical protein
VGRTRAPAAAVRDRATSLLDARPRDRGRRASDLCTPRHECPLLQPACRRLAPGLWRKDRGERSSFRAIRLPERFDLFQPSNQRKLDAVEELARLAEETGVTLVQLAIAFVFATPRSAARSSDRARSSTWRATPLTSHSTGQCSIGSASSCHPDHHQPRRQLIQLPRPSNQPRVAARAADMGVADLLAGGHDHRAVVLEAPLCARKAGRASRPVRNRRTPDPWGFSLPDIPGELLQDWRRHLSANRRQRDDRM